MSKCQKGRPLMCDTDILCFSTRIFLLKKKKKKEVLVRERECIRWFQDVSIPAVKICLQYGNSLF